MSKHLYVIHTHVSHPRPNTRHFFNLLNFIIFYVISALDFDRDLLENKMAKVTGNWKSTHYVFAHLYMGVTEYSF